MTAADVNMLHRSALWYARHNLYVFPVHAMNGKTCTCRKRDCTSPGKHPRTPNGFLDATLDTDQIDQWWETWPNANVAIACGPSGLAVIDVDIDKGGDESLHDLEAKHGQLPDTVRAITGGGGAHIIYRMPGYGFPSRVSLAPGLDTRGDGGYIVATPSNHESGGVYGWEVDHRIGEIPLADVPLWFLEMMQDAGKKEGDRVDAEAILQGVAEGDRDHQLFLLASKYRGADLPIEDAYFLMERTAARCSPPFPLDKARSKVDWTYKRYEGGSTAYASPDDAKHADGLAGRVLLGEALKNGLPAVEWLIEPVLVRGAIHMLYGEPESGKTIITLSWVVQCVQQGLDVLYIDEESGRRGIVRLLEAMGADHTYLDEHLHYFEFPGIDKGAYEALLAYADELKPVLIVFDSLTDMLAVAGLDENSGIEVTGWMLDVAQRLARRDYAPVVDLIDHVTKDTANVKYSVASRAKKTKADVLWYVAKTADFDQENTAPVDLIRHKNRPGVLPQKLRYTVGGDEGKLICRPFDPLQDGISGDDVRAQEALEALESAGSEGLSNAQLQDLLHLGHSKVWMIMSALEKGGQVAHTGAARSIRYVLLKTSMDDF